MQSVSVVAALLFAVSNELSCPDGQQPQAQEDLSFFIFMTLIRSLSWDVVGLYTMRVYLQAAAGMVD